MRLAARAGIVAVAVLVTATISTGAVAAPQPNPSALPYANTSWTTLHGDAGNHKYVDTRVATAYTSKWLRLAGAALTAAPSIGPGGRIYQTVAQGPGHSDLYAFDTAGNELWHTPAWTDGSGLDSCAGYQTPIIDRSGDLYVSDCNQMWAFHPDGTVKWVTPLPSAPPGSPFQESTRNVPDNSFVTAAFADEHSVFGATIFGQLVSFDRSTGALNAPVATLPGGPGPAVAAPPASLWTGADWIDPEIINPLWQIAFAGNVVSANTPAVDPRSGRIFVVATASDPTKGALYGIDLLHTPGGGRQFSIAFAAPVGQGSGSSPTLSPDGQHAYVTDNNGVLYSVNTRTGAVEWHAQTDSLAQSVTVGPNGRIYVAGSADMFAFNANGQQVWHTTFASVASNLPTLPTTGPWANFGPAAGTPAGPMTITNGLLVDPMNVGYPFTIPNTTITAPIAVGSVLVGINPDTGAVVRTLGSEVDSAGANTPIDAASGLILAPHSAFTTLTAGLAPLVNSLLGPFGLQQLAAVGGLEALAPAS
jgi:hypothetical protein